jgi:hypothetical protein
MDNLGSTRKLCECGCGEPAPLAERTAKRFGWVKGEPKRFINGHNRRKGSADYVVEDRGYETPCWIWQRSLNNKGYALARRDGRTRAMHRWYYEQVHGPIPESKQLDHLCRQRACVRVDHLEVVTHAENLQRGNSAKLTPADVRLIRASHLSAQKMADLLGVHQRTVQDVRSGARWSNVT